ncbi:MAG: Tad domain-containing protein, partial [Selenomonadaceae bacterium]|nr:Tad domain-containing protein [Selenomonadaceae bacterium]
MPPIWGGHSRGQVAVFYALLIPIILFMGGVGLDLGWYYLNVSRLQNAADAACLAGVQKFLSGGDESLY